MSKSDLKLNSISPYRNKLVAVILFLFGIISFIALADYDPEDFHSSPTMSDSPVLGKTGLFIARSFNGWFGVSSWFLPWLFINLFLQENRDSG